MINKSDVIEFFDQCAPSWDKDLIRNEDVIGKILDNAGVTEGVQVLDVACGTGVLFQDYIRRGVKSVTGVDISTEMTRRAAEKFPESQIRVICGDVEEISFDDKFDVVMVYNAFPHFPDSQHLIEVLASLTKEGGRMTIAHGMSRSQIDSHHKGFASKVSNGLMHEEELKKLFEPYFDVDVVISDDEMYQVAGVRKKESLCE